MSFNPGDNVGPYTIIEQLGQGGMATVFKAYHAALDRNVAIKVLHPAFTQDPQFLQRFQREARVVAKLEHPNIVPVYDYADHQGQSYLVMKFIEGRTLKAMLDQGWPSKQDILRIIKAVGNALTYAHSKGVLHRDVKPSNILLTDDGGVFLADFGLARMAGAGQSTLSGDQLLGTPQYISPEQARGEQKLDEGTDIYSLGIVLYQLSVGRVPFSSDTPFSIIHDHIYKPLPLPRSLNEKIPEGLEQVLLKGLAKDRADRFASVAEQLGAFERAVTGASPWGPGQSALAALPVGVPVAVGDSEPEPGVVGLAANASPPRSGTAGGSKSLGKRWPWVAGGLALSALSMLTFAFAMANAVNGDGAAQPDPPLGVVEDAPALNDQPFQSIVESPGNQDRLTLAQQAVEQLPDDPKAHAELAEAFAVAGLTENATQEYSKAAELFLLAPDYSAAADAALRAIELSGQSPDADLRLQGLLTQAIFLGAGSEMMPAIERLDMLAPEWPPLQVLRARSLLFIGEQEKANSILQDTLGRQPGDLLASAAMVDVEIAQGETARARELAQSLVERDRVPPWLRQHLESQLRNL